MAVVGTVGRVHAPPSARSASALVRGEAGSLLEVTVHLCARAVFLSAGMYLAGCPTRDLPRYALAGAAALEVILIAYAAHGEGLMVAGDPRVRG